MHNSTADFYLRSIHLRNCDVGQSCCFPWVQINLQQRKGTGILQGRTPGFGNPIKYNFSPELLRMLNVSQPPEDLHKGLGAVNPTLVLASLKLEWVYACSCTLMQLKEFTDCLIVSWKEPQLFADHNISYTHRRTSLQKDFTHWRLNGEHLRAEWSLAVQNFLLLLRLVIWTPHFANLILYPTE